MYIFSRTRQARSDKILEATAAGVEIAGKVSTITGHDIHCWAVRFGQPMGTMMWSVRIDSQADLYDATAKMTADSSYIDMAMGMNEYFEGNAHDRLGRLVSGTPSEEPARFIGITEASMAAGKYAEAMAFGVDMQEFVADQLGVATVFAKDVYGGFADVLWLTAADSMEQVDSQADWQMSNAEYLEKVAAADGLFIDGSGHNGLIERLT